MVVIVTGIVAAASTFTTAASDAPIPLPAPTTITTTPAAASDCSEVRSAVWDPGSVRFQRARGRGTNQGFRGQGVCRPRDNRDFTVNRVGFQSPDTQSRFEFTFRRATALRLASRSHTLQDQVSEWFSVFFLFYRCILGTSATTSWR